MERFEIEIFPFRDAEMPDRPKPSPIRTGVVSATGKQGASGFPHFAGDGIEAEIDPATAVVEAITVDGSEPDEDWSVRAAPRPASPDRRDASHRP